MTKCKWCSPSIEKKKSNECGAVSLRDSTPLIRNPCSYSYDSHSHQPSTPGSQRSSCALLSSGTKSLGPSPSGTTLSSSAPFISNCTSKNRLPLHQSSPSSPSQFRSSNKSTASLTSSSGTSSPLTTPSNHFLSSSSTNLTTSYRRPSPSNTYKLSDFQLLSSKLLGHGAFGEVYEAKSHLSELKDKPLALKFINHTQLSKKHRERIHMEIQLHQQMSSHPSILTFYSFFETKEGIYLVLEHCPHGDLYSFLKLHGTFSEPQVRWVLLHLVPAFDFLHRHHVIHRDIKLSNILLTNHYQLKLADFGLATLNQGEHHTLCGTPNYLAPEMIQMGSSHGPAVDIWALGCLVYTLFTGDPPFDHAQVQVTLAHIAATQRHPFVCTHLTPTHSAEAVQLVTQCLQADPARRPSFRELRSHAFLHAACPTQPLAPAPVSTRRLARGTYPFPHQVLRVHSQGHVSQKLHGQPDLIVSHDGRHCQLGANRYTYPMLPPPLLCRYLHVHHGVVQLHGHLPKIHVHLPHAHAVWTQTHDFHLAYPDPTHLDDTRLVCRHGQVQLYRATCAVGTPFPITHPHPAVPKDVWVWVQAAWHLCVALNNTATAFPVTLHWPPKTASAAPATRPTHTVYLQGIGFCTRDAQGFRMYFDDGSVLEMQSHPGAAVPAFWFGVAAEDGHVAMEAYRLDQAVKPELKKKLGLFAQGVQAMKKSNGQVKEVGKS